MAFLRGGHPNTETMSTKNAVEICKCIIVEDCSHLVPIKLDPDKIQEGDFVKHHPTGTSGKLLGVDTRSGKACGIHYPSILAELAHCALVRKGEGITQVEYRHRHKIFGAGWDNEHALEDGPEDPDQEQPEGEAPAPLPVRKPKEAPPMEFGKKLGMLDCPSCKAPVTIVEVTNYPGQMFGHCFATNCGNEFRPGKYWADKLKPLTDSAGRPQA